MVRKREKIRVGISIGDINGVGVELFLKCMSKTSLLDKCTPVLFASMDVCEAYRRKINQKQINTLTFEKITHIDKIIEGAINIIELWKDKIDITPGIAKKKMGKYARLSLLSAMKALELGHIDTLVTAPLNKELVYHKKEFPFIGHTPYLAHAFKKEPLMFMLHEQIKVALLTDHLPLKKVSSFITRDLLFEKLNILIHSLQRDFFIAKPKIALLSLNPHAGDKGLIGKEDEKIIKPIIEDFSKQGMDVSGPFAADGFFGSGHYRYFDAILAMYHDQGLIPFKMLAFNQGVHFTAGLPYIRTSPDHGVAYDKAGSFKADESSFLKAIYSSMELFNNRLIYMNKPTI